MTTLSFRIYVVHNPHNKEGEWEASCADPLPRIAPRFGWMGTSTMLRAQGATREGAVEKLRETLRDQLVKESKSESITIEQDEIAIDIQ